MNKLFKFLLICCLLLSFQAYSKEVRLVHITDINLNTTNAYKLQKTIEEINSFKDIDFIVFGGNNIQKANIDYLNTFLYLLKKTNKKPYVLIGSNDVLSSYGIDKEYYFKRVRKALWFRHSNKPNYVFKKNGYVFIAMDGSKQHFKSANGYYTKSEITWLEKQLKKYSKENVIILQHFPILDTEEEWLRTAKTENYKELLSKYKNVKVIISGHFGENKEVKQDGIYHIITESYSKQGAYKIIEIDLDYDFVATYLIKN